jgi:hypothetical protein
VAVPISIGFGQWTIPWEGGVAGLSVSQNTQDRVAMVKLDGRLIATFAQPTLKAPWAEHQLSDRPAVKVVQIAYPRQRYRVLAFVDERSLDDHRTEAEWRAEAPAPMDDFEIKFGTSRWFSPLGVAAAGAIPAALGVLAWLGSGKSIALAIAAGTFILVSGWLAANVLLVRWFTRRRSWSSDVRQIVVGLIFAGEVLAVIILLGALGSAH